MILHRSFQPYIPLSANEIRLCATGLQSSALDHITCEHHVRWRTWSALIGRMQARQSPFAARPKNWKDADKPAFCADS